MSKCGNLDFDWAQSKLNRFRLALHFGERLREDK